MASARMVLINLRNYTINLLLLSEFPFEQIDNHGDGCHMLGSQLTRLADSESMLTFINVTADPLPTRTECATCLFEFRPVLVLIDTASKSMPHGCNDSYRLLEGKIHLPLI